MIDYSTVLPTFVVTLREGFEATLIVGIVFTCLQKANQQKYYNWIWLGVIAGILTSITIGLLLWQSLASIEGSNASYAPFYEQLLKTALITTAIVMLSWMLIWMSKQAKSIQGEVQNTIDKVLQNDRDLRIGAGIFLLQLRRHHGHVIVPDGVSGELIVQFGHVFDDFPRRLILRGAHSGGRARESSAP